MVPVRIEYREFLARLSEKFGLRRVARCKVRDEDGDGRGMVVVGDQEDLDMVFGGARREARRRGEEVGRVEVSLES